MNSVQRIKSKGGSAVLGEIPAAGQPAVALATSSTEQSFLSSKSAAPTLLELHGIHVCFPFEPYPCQKDYMASVIRALHLSENALLESPTGTGEVAYMKHSYSSYSPSNILKLK